jgi:RNA polymerase sigma factor (sigma-70 family)
LRVFHDVQGAPFMEGSVADRREARRGLAELYARHAPEGRALAYLLTGDRQVAEDLVQEAFLRVTGRFGHLRDVDAFPGYLRRTIVNLHTSALRRLRLERAHAQREHTVGEPRVDLPDVARRTDLWLAVRALPARQRAALVLRFWLDQSEAETAETMRCSTSAVNSLVARGLATLRSSDRIRIEDA